MAGEEKSGLEQRDEMFNNSRMPKKNFKGMGKAVKAKGMAKPSGIKEKVINIVDLYTLIAQKRYPSVKSLSEHFEVSERAVFRYLEIIKMIDPVIFDREKGGYAFEHGDRIKKMSLSDDDFMLLMTVSETVAHLGSPIKASFNHFVDSLMNISKKPFADEKGPQVIINMPDAVENEDLAENFRSIMTSINERRTIFVIYNTLYSRSRAHRKIDPYGVVFYEGAWILTGYCHKRKCIRNFALDRIAALQETNYYFKPIENFDLKQYFHGSWGIYNDESVEITVRFSETVADYIIRKDKWHPSEKRKLLSNGDIELTFTVAGVAEVKRWLYSWAPNVEVVSPDWFRDLVKKDFSVMNIKHKEGKE